MIRLQRHIDSVLLITLLAVAGGGAALSTGGCSSSGVAPGEEQAGGSSEAGGKAGSKGGATNGSSQSGAQAGSSAQESSGRGGQSNRGGAGGASGGSSAPSETGGKAGSTTAHGVGGAAGSSTPPGSGGRGGGGGATNTGRGGTLGVGGGGSSGAAGVAGRGGSAGSAGSSGPGGSQGTGGTNPASTLDHFSFFVTSVKSIQALSGSKDGFGGDLRFGKADGLSGADEICRQVAESSMPGSGAKQWRAFLSVTKGPAGTPVNAIDRVGEGPWYDRVGRLVAKTTADLAQTRPNGADPEIINDLPNEDGVPNHAPDNAGQVDNHDTLTGSDAQGKLFNSDWSCTCHDWTSTVGKDGKPRVGHTWPRSGGMTSTNSMNHWISALDEAGCGAGINLVETGPPNPQNPTVGSGGGYGGIYCFALTP